ncbi:hypothetical protein L6R53_33020 [Myxococcota bacterium]|nr:hypothetical protein [Myxococcota bacterium]
MTAPLAPLPPAPLPLAPLLLAPLLLALGLLACRPAPPAPGPTRMELRFPSSRSGELPRQQGNARDRAAELQVELPDGPWMEQATLRLPDLFGRARVTVDDLPPFEVVGGPGPVDLPLPTLAPGTHRFRVEASVAPDLSAVLIGGDGPRTASLMEAPLLLLRPAAHVQAMAFPVVDGQVSGRAQVHGAPAGAVVHFVLSRDGEVVEDLGRAPVQDGWAASAPRPLRAPAWTPASPRLLSAHAILEDAQGKVVDAAGARVGLRQVALTERGFRLGDEELRIVAARSGASLTPERVIQDTLAVGANAVEFHGAPPTRSQLDALDEVGLVAVLTHRCDGAFRRVLANHEIGAHIAAHQAALALQDRRLSWEMARHPSVALWVNEAAAFPDLGRLMIEADPERRPVVGVDLPLMTVMDGPARHGRSYQGSFIVESAWNGPQGDSSELAAGFLEALEQGARGGVIEHVHEPTRVQAWAAAVARMGEGTAEVEGRRATTRVAVSGGTPGQVAWLEGPWLVAEAAVVDAQGRATLETWYEGPATLHVGGVASPVPLRAPEWGAGATLPEAAAVAKPAG